MADITYVQDGPHKREYSLSPNGNYEIDQNRHRLANNQGNKTTRDSLTEKVKKHGGEVKWSGEPRQKIVLPYTSKNHQDLKEMEKKVAERMKKLIDSGVGIDKTLTSYHNIDDFLTGQASFNIIYNAEGHVEVQKLEKGVSPAPRPYGFTEAIGVLRTLDRYAENVEKVVAIRNKMNNKKSGLENIVDSSKVMVLLAAAYALTGTLMMSGGITGYAVLNAPKVETAGNIVGLIMFVAGCVGLFVHYHNKKF